MDLGSPFKDGPASFKLTGDISINKRNTSTADPNMSTKAR